MKYVIVGNSTAGISAVEAIRSRDKEGAITVVSCERYATYSRPLITYWLAGKVDDKRMYYKGKPVLEDQNVKFILGKKATKIDTKKKIVVLEGGKQLAYDRLLLATGGGPIMPPVKGNKLRGVFTFINWDNAKSVRRYLDNNDVKRVVVVGGGLIGLKTTEALVELGLKVTVMELMDNILSATLDKKASQIMINYLKDRGVDIQTGNTVEEIVGEKSKVSAVKLRNGKRLSCEIVIFAIGVRPNMDLVEGTKIRTDKGILVDEYMKTSIPNVFAAGDVVQARDTLMNIHRPIAIWPLAVKQGKTAGQNMAGETVEYAGGFPMNSIEIHGLPSISVGITNPKGGGYSVIQDYRPEESVYRKIVLKNQTIKGVILVGNIERAGLFTGLIETKADIGDLKNQFLQDDFGLIILPDDYVKHRVTKAELQS